MSEWSFLEMRNYYNFQVLKPEPEPKEDRKRKVALLIAYNGKGYYGLQM